MAVQNLTEILEALVGSNEYIPIVASVVGGLICLLTFDVIRRLVLHIFK